MKKILWNYFIWGIDLDDKNDIINVYTTDNITFSKGSKMPSYAPICVGCSAEDCVCCGVYLEWRADQSASQDPSYGDSYADEVDDYEDYDDDFEDEDDDYEDDGQPSEYDEWQDYMGGDDSDHGQYDNDW